MTWREAMLAAAVATVGRGRWWLVALASFMVRGGLLALLPAILVIPTPAELASNLTPSLTGAAPGDLTPALLDLAAKVVAVLAAALVLTTLAGAWLERALVGEVAAATRLATVGRSLDVPLARAVVARLLTHLPTLLAVGVGTVALAGAAYAEVVSPSSSGSLGERIVARVPGAVAAIGVAWLLGEAWGGTTLRRLGDGEGLAIALGRGIADLVRPSGLATLTLTTVVVATPAVGLWLAAARAFARLWPLVVDHADLVATIGALSLLAVVWAVGLSLLAIALAFRSAAWTAETLRRG